MASPLVALVVAIGSAQASSPGNEPSEYRGTTCSDEWHIVGFAADVSGAAFLGNRGIRRDGSKIRFKMLVVYNHKQARRLGYDQELATLEADCSTNRARQTERRLRLAHGPDRLARPKSLASTPVHKKSIAGAVLDMACGRKALGERAYFPYTFAHGGFRLREGTLFAPSREE